ncbi:MAG: RHS repeat-associated core domain-containing protein [Caldilineaceae bacterium]
MTAAFGNSYGYDANGNQTTRTIGGVTYTFTYDYENHLTAVSGGSISASFVYDADGNRVKGTVNGTTTVYLAGLYEYQSGATTLYYEGNALRRTGYATDNGVFYLLQDQLKSSSALINQNGTVNSRNYFDPFGGNRGGAAFSALTTKRFTGQYHEAGLPGGEGLSYYGARWYDAQLGRFASPDTIVPGPTNPQTFNRYAYTLNNPLSYTDSTGHSVDGPGVGSYDYSGSYSSTCNTWTGCNATTPLVQSCAYNACRDRDVSTTIRFYANTYGIPEHLLGATMMTEAIDDQQWK